MSYPRRCTSESNDNIFGMWQEILRKFDTEQILRIVDKKHLKMKAIYESDRLTSRCNSSFKGYQETFTNVLESLKAAASIIPPYGSINVDPVIPEVKHIWH